MSDQARQQADIPSALPNARIYSGGVIMIVGFMSPLLITVVANFDMSVEWKVAVTGFLLAGIPEVFMLIAVAIMGKSGYQYLKKCARRLLRRYGSAERVGVLRHRIGLCMFVVPLLIGLLSPYVADVLPWHAERELQISIASDIVFVSSLFVLGGEFWDKLRGLFIHEAGMTLSGN